MCQLAEGLRRFGQVSAGAPERRHVEAQRVGLTCRDAAARSAGDIDLAAG